MNGMVQGKLSLCFAQYAVVQLVELPRYKPEGWGFDSWSGHCGPHFGPGIDSASNRIEYQGCFLEVKETSA